MRELIGIRRARPAADLITDLIEVADAGDRLNEDEIVCTVIVLLNAGHEATVNTLGIVMRALLTHPDQWLSIVGDEGDEVEPATAVDGFDVSRGESTHIGFGGGVPFCIGAPLARLEAGRSAVPVACRGARADTGRPARVPAVFRDRWAASA